MQWQGIYLDDLLVGKWSQRVEHNHNQVAGTSDSDDLTTTTLTVLGTFDDTRQVQQLNLGTL